MSDCNPNSDGRSGLVTDIGTSKFLRAYTCTSGGVDTPIPFPIDDDQSLPHLIPEVSDVSAFDYLALKSSIIAIEKAIAGTSGEDLGNLVDQMDSMGLAGHGFTSIAGALYRFNSDMFVPIAGNAGTPMTGSLILGSQQKTAWGQYCETYAVFVGNDSVTSVNLPPIGAPVLPFENDGSVPLVIPLAIVGHDATPTVANTHHRRVKIFDDLDVVEDIRAGRDVIGDRAYFNNLYLMDTSLEDLFVHTAGDDMYGNLVITTGASLKVDNAAGKVSLDASDSANSPTLEFKDLEGTWSVNSRLGSLHFNQSGANNYSVIFRNTGVPIINMAVSGQYMGLAAGSSTLSDSSIDLGRAGQVVIGSVATSGSVYGDTASSSHYLLTADRSSKNFNGSQDLIAHFDNVNAHHEEFHGLESHLVYDSGTFSYRNILLPEINKSFGEMIEVLINQGNADLYHTHGGVSLRWGGLSYSDANPITITDYLEANYCHKPCGAGSGDAIYWDTLEKNADDAKTIETWINDNICSVIATQGCGEGGTVRWGALGKSEAEPSVTIEDYVAEIEGNIHTWASETFCPKSGGCGGAGGGVIVNSLGSGVEVYSGIKGSPTGNLNFKSVSAVSGSGLAVTENAGTVLVGYAGGSGTIPKGTTLVYADYATFMGVSGTVETRPLKDSGDIVLTTSIIMSRMGIPAGYVPADFNWYISGGWTGIVNTAGVAIVASFYSFKCRPFNDGTVISPSFRVSLALGPAVGQGSLYGVGFTASYMITATKR